MMAPPFELELEATRRDDPVVLALYADFIREADGPLGIDLEAEIAEGPPRDLTPPGGILLLARLDGTPAGLGGVRHLETDVAEIKSMFVAPGFRGRGGSAGAAGRARGDRPPPRLPCRPARHLRLPDRGRRPLPRRRLRGGRRLQRQPQGQSLVRASAGRLTRRIAPLSCSGPSGAARAQGRSERRGGGSRSAGGSRR